MSHTNSTTNYALPQFLTTDKPAWLTDVNNAFSDIDSAIYAAKSKADTAFTDAGNAQSDATTAINDAAAADAKGSGAIASIEANFDPTAIYSVGAKVMYNSLLYRCIVAVVTPGPWTGSDNWERITVDSLISTTDSKIGLLSSLSTSDKSSVVNAINEVNGKGSAGAITPESTKGTFTACYQSIIGDVVIVQGVFACTANISDNLTPMFKLPYGLHPSTNSSSFIMYDNTAGNSVNCRMNNAGEVIPIDLVATGHSYRFTFSYIK